MAEVFTDETNVVFGITEDCLGLITSKVTVTRKTEKKELRGRLGGYKAVVAYGKTYEISVDGAVPGGSFSMPALADTVSNSNLPSDMALPSNLFIESVDINESNEDFKTVSIKLFGSDAISLA